MRKLSTEQKTALREGPQIVSVTRVKPTEDRIPTPPCGPTVNPCAPGMCGPTHIPRPQPPR